MSADTESAFAVVRRCKIAAKLLKIFGFQPLKFGIFSSRIRRGISMRSAMVVGLISLPRQDYWSKDEVFNERFFPICDCAAPSCALKYAFEDMVYVRVCEDTVYAVIVFLNIITIFNH